MCQEEKTLTSLAPPFCYRRIVSMLFLDSNDNSKVIKHTHTVYKIIGPKKSENDHKHHGEVIHKHIHGGHVDHVHKHDGHGHHEHKHHGHAEHGHTHHGHSDHKHAHAFHGVHDHKHAGHAEHGHKHHGHSDHKHSHQGHLHGVHKHTGNAEHGHKHLGHVGHEHAHTVHGGHTGSHDYHSRAFDSGLSPVHQYETYEYLDDLPAHSYNPYYGGYQQEGYHAGYSRLGRYY
ncbi:hypothetical protein J6590_018848 [Homalodisca vitripennis]|nr:hypothetical protein J6590_018848 [Homalodisca vitripennis]